jgi:putative DNA primase/helicase
MNDYEKAFMFIGSGSNGKGVLLHVLTNFLGQQNITDHAIQLLCGENYYTGTLFGKMANICNDIEPNALKNAGNIKMLISGDPTTGREIFGKPFSFKNRAKLIFSTNEPPIVYDDSDGWHRRWEHITFPNTFSDELGNKDPNLRQKLMNEKEFSGILNWALEGMFRVFDNKKFTNSQSTAEVRAYYTRVSDPVSAFVEDCIQFDDEHEIPKQAVYDAFLVWAAEHKVLKMSHHVFGKKLSFRFKKQVHTGQTTIGGARYTTYRGMTCVGFDMNEFCYNNSPKSDYRAYKSEPIATFEDYVNPDVEPRSDDEWARM